MKSVKCKYKQKKQRYSTICKIKYPVVLQESIFTALNANKSDYLLPLNIVKKGKKKVKFEAFCQEFKPLNLWFKQPVEKNLFFKIVLNIISDIRKCQDIKLNIDNLELDIKYILYNKQLNIVKLIYWPIVNNVDYVTPYLFFKNLITDVHFTNQDLQFLYDYNDYMSSLKPFSLVDFENFIMGLQGKKKATSDIAPAQNLSMLSSNHRDHVIGSQGVASNVSYDPLQISSSVNKSSNKLSGKVRSRAVLIRNINNTQIPINSPVFKMGKSPDANNYCLSDNPAISRCHACILHKNNRYYIIDNNSTNHTYVNGIKLQPHKEYAISSNDKIKMANESFCFVC